MILEIILLNLIYILFPIFCYLIYVTYQKTIGRKVNGLFFDLSLLSSIYLILKYGTFSNNIYNMMLLHIVLIIAFCNKRSAIAILLSIYLIGYYNQIYNYNLILLSLEYITFSVLYIFSKKELSNTYIIVTFNAINILFNTIFAIIFNDAVYSLYSTLYCILFALMSYLIVMLIKKSEDVIELNTTIKRLEKEKTLRNSLFKITHEIKNPIAVCKGYLDMLDTDNVNQVNKYIPIIKQEINRTLTLMNDFLSLTKLKVNKTKLDVVLLLEDSCYALETLLEMNNIDFDYSIKPENIYIDGDYDRLKQVIMNVIKNSIEAMDKEKKGSIKLAAYNEAKYLIIKIEDNGVGMDKETLKKIGEAFFTTKSNGTGLGIKLSKEIIEAHDGDIIYSSKEGSGTTVIIKIPVKIST